MKLLWISSGPWLNEPESVISRRIIPYFEGYDVTYFALSGFEGIPQYYKMGEKDVEIIGTSVNQEEAIIYSYDKVKPDLVIYCGEPKGLTFKVLKSIPVIGWVPLLLDEEKDNLQYLRLMKKIFVFTEQSVYLLNKKRVKNVFYVPCPVDNSNTVLDMKASRDSLGIDSTATMITMVGKNDEYGAAGFIEGFQVLHDYLNNYNNTAIFYIHTDMENPVNLVQYSKDLGLKLYYPHPSGYRLGMNHSEYMTLLYNASNVIFLPNRYEGFGLHAIESMRCGTPACISNTSIYNEYRRLGIASRLISTESFWYPEINGLGIRIHRPFGSREIDHLIRTFKGSRDVKKLRLEISDSMRHRLPEEVYKNYLLKALEVK